MLFPSLLALAGLVGFWLTAMFGWIEDRALFLVILFAFAELVMILAGGGAVIYLLSRAYTQSLKHLAVLNIALFFLAAGMGLVTFLQL